MRERSKLPKNAVEDLSGKDFEAAMRLGLDAGCDVRLWAWRPEVRSEDGDPGWRMQYQRVTFDSVLGHARKKMSSVIEHAAKEYQRHCTAAPATGLPEKGSDWNEAATLLCDLFATGLTEGVSVELSCLLPDSKFRAPSRMERRSRHESVLDVSAEDTYYEIEWSESHGGSETQWLVAGGPDLLDTLRRAHALMADAQAGMVAEDERIERQREHTRRLREQRAAAAAK